MREWNVFNTNLQQLNSLNSNETIHSFIHSFIVFLLTANVLIAQNNTDSLKQALQMPANDTTRVQQLIALGKYYNNQNIDSALLYYNQAQLVATKSNNKQGLAKTLSATGYSYYLKANYPMALGYQLKALKLYSQLQNQAEIAFCYNDIGRVYVTQQRYDKALYYYNKALVIAKRIGNTKKIAIYTNNIGLVYLRQNKNDKALVCFNDALALHKSIGNTLSESKCLTNIAIVYYNKTNYPKALEYYQQALAIKERLNDKDGMSLLYYNIGDVNYLLKQYQTALGYYYKGLALSKELGDADNTRLCYLGLSETQNYLGNYKEAYQNHVAFQELNDSIFNEENSKQLSDLKTNFEVDKKAVELNAKHDIETAKQNAELKTKCQQQYALFGGLALVLVFAGVMYNRFKVTQKQKHIIELKEQETVAQNIIITEQKKLVEHKHQEITESVDYAERIQQGYLVSHDFLNQELKTGFVLFKPKDKVSGDFYWAEKGILNDKLEILNEQESRLREPQCPPQSKIYVCVADSTGHGVPGAFMSMLNMSFLSEATQSKQYSNTADILNFVRQMLIKGIKPNAKGEGGNDGMDCVLFSINYNTLELEFTGANNSLWIVRALPEALEGKSENALEVEGLNECTSRASVPETQKNSAYELIELKGDKMPVGRSMKSDTSFTAQIFQLQKGDWIYASTDGFPDQFGGEKGKKYMSKNLKETLLSICHLHEDEQKQQLDAIFENWKGSLEQVDDVTVMGIRI